MMKPEKRKNCGIISGGAGCGQYPGKNYAAFLRLVFYIVCFSDRTEYGHFWIFIFNSSA